MPAEGEDDAVGITTPIEGLGVLVGIEIDMTQAILVGSLHEESFSPISDCAGYILLPTRVHEIGILTVERRVDGYRFKSIAESALERISGIEV